MPRADTTLDLVQLDEDLDVGSKLRADIRPQHAPDHAPSPRRSPLAARDGFMLPRRRVPAQHRIAVLAEMPPMRIPQRALARVGLNWRTATSLPGYRRHAGTQRVDHLDVRLGTAFVGRPKCHFVQQAAQSACNLASMRNDAV